MTTRTARKPTLAPDISQFLPNVQAPRRRERRHPPKNETARDRFIRIGGQRMRNVLRDLRLLGNLASNNYDVTARDVQMMQRAIASAMDQSFSRFAKKQSKKLEDQFSIT